MSSSRFPARHEGLRTCLEERAGFFKFVENVMSNQIADVFVHVDESLTRDQLITLENHIHEIDGVVSACNRDDQPHVISVTYDPSQTNAYGILTRVKREGFHAQLVGL